MAVNEKDVESIVKQILNEMGGVRKARGLASYSLEIGGRIRSPRRHMWQCL